MYILDLYHNNVYHDKQKILFPKYQDVNNYANHITFILAKW